MSLPTNNVPNEVVLQSETQSLGLSVNPCAEWYESIRVKRRLGDEMILVCDLITYVRNSLFPRLKFFMDPRQLMYSNEVNTICYQICKDMGIREEKRHYGGSSTNIRLFKL